MYIINAFKHFKNVMIHRRLVRHYCFKVGLYRQGLIHDLSKFSYTEFRVGVKYYLPDQSPHNGERKDIGYSTAWLHHKGRNKHHIEYWWDFKFLPNGKPKMCGLKMPSNYLIEMVCDRIAASRVYNGKNYNDGCPYQYFDERREFLIIDPDTHDMLEKLLVMLRDEGEEKVFHYMKTELKDKGLDY